VDRLRPETGGTVLHGHLLELELEQVPVEDGATGLWPQPIHAKLAAKGS